MQSPQSFKQPPSPNRKQLLPSAPFAKEGKDEENAGEVNPLPFYSVRRQQPRSAPLPQPPHGANKRQRQNKGSAGAAGPRLGGAAPAALPAGRAGPGALLPQGRAGPGTPHMAPALTPHPPRSCSR